MAWKTGSSMVSALCVVILMLHIHTATSIQCYSCQHFNVTVLEDSAGISIDMVETFMASNLDFCGDDGDSFKMQLEGNDTNPDMYKKVCKPATTRCTKTWGMVEFTYPYRDNSARYRIDYYVRGCDTMERLELPGAAPPGDGDAGSNPQPPPPGEEGAEPPAKDAVDPYKPKDKCYNETYYLHSALDHQFFTYEDIVFTDASVCYCTGASLCNTAAAALSQSAAYVIGLLAAVVTVLIRIH